jgi:CDP-diacylglycerol--serine O-phosphatidyltransferase
MLRLLSVADFISITNAVFGVLAIIVLFIDIIDSLELRIHISISLILIALLADGLDGIVARRFGKSLIGDYLESMADMTSMVVAPAVFIFFVYSDVLFSEILRNIWLFVAVGLFLFFGIVRLGSFNIMKEKNRYVGLPASASAIILVILCYLRVNFLFILPTVIIMGALMASDFVFPKTDKKMNLLAFILILLTILFGREYYNFAPILLLIAVFFYTFGGAIYMKFYKLPAQKDF